MCSSPLTGDIHVFRAEHFGVMKDGAILANAGHFDVEIDLNALGELAESRRGIRRTSRSISFPTEEGFSLWRRVDWSISARPKVIRPT